MLSTLTQDSWINTELGRLYARRWSPATSRSHDHASIVLFHDSLGCVALWRDVPERLALATGRDVVAYDRLGFGRSDPHPGSLTNRFVHDEARASFRAVREQLQIKHFIAFGHSVGGGMAIVCAASDADFCDGLIVESAQVFVEPHTLDGIRQAKRLFQQPGQLERLKKYHGDKAAWVLSAWMDTWLASDFTDWNLDTELRHIRCPILAIYGDQDEYSSLRQPERIDRFTAGRMTLKVMEACGHVPHRENTQAVVDLVTQRLA
ncbi:alpha/beta fold hydrolase [Dyella nitratireducens]|uniref:alpha/beta fold hydrolase n=1 Tax=Dyella nitratireducens TaxID=1849580 RepID=UPI001668C8D5|nr:alpha/beta hydrolase [Dyella nitratireducens]